MKDLAAPGLNLPEAAPRSLCTDCGLSRTPRAGQCGMACQFIKPDYPGMERRVHGRTREAALARLRRALVELVVDGVDTTVPLFHALMDEPDIRTGNYDIHWLESWLERATPA